MSEDLVMKEEQLSGRFSCFEPTFPKSAREETWITYRISSFTFSLCGIFMLTTGARCHNSWAATIFGWCLIFQGPISYLNDQHYLGYPTIWRPIDRCYATAMTIVAILYGAWFANVSDGACLPRWDHHAILWPGIVIGITFYWYSAKAAASKNLHRFQIFHILWHLSLPMAGSYVILF